MEYERPTKREMKKNTAKYKLRQLQVNAALLISTYNS